MMRLKPSFAKKLNPKGYTPIHLALLNDQTEVVLQLVDVDQNLVSLQGRDGIRSLHIAALEGIDKIVAKFLVSHPKSIEQLTIRKETALHIAVKYGHIETLKILLEWTKKEFTNSILNWSDNEGNNIMHLSVLGNRIEMVKLLLEYNVDIKSKNFEGSTVLDILRQNEFLEDKELREMLDGGHNIIVNLLRLAMSLLKWILWFIKRLLIPDYHEIQYMPKEDRNAILVVSVLIATATYQAILSPPDQDKNKFNEPLRPGYTSYMYYYIMLGHFKIFNTLTFIASMMEIFLHLPSGIGYTLHLVLPLVICYVLLMLYWWEYYNGVITTMGIFCLFLTKIPLFRQKISGASAQRSRLRTTLNTTTKWKEN